jgi:uncharacterized protein with PIN domain
LTVGSSREGADTCPNIVELNAASAVMRDFYFGRRGAARCFWGIPREKLRISARGRETAFAYNGAMTSSPGDPRFFCDAMLGGLARWLRAAGYDAAFEYGIDDGDLVRRAEKEGRTVLSSDGGLFERNVITSGTLPALFIPRQMSKFDQLRFVLRELKLSLRTSRCMACGGELLKVPKHQAVEQVPPLAFRRCERFWRCGRCGKLLWSGTHWQRITRRLDAMADEMKDGTKPSE